MRIKKIITIVIISTLFTFGNTIDLNEFKLVWHDEFNSGLDLEKWSYRYLGPRKLGYNCKKSVLVKDGKLLIKTFLLGNKICSGMISTENSFNFKYGYLEARVKLPTVSGIQSSIWLQSKKLSHSLDDVTNSGAEIDIFEYIAKTPNILHFSIHWNGYGKYHRKKHKSIYIPTINDGEWHIIGFYWNRDEYTLYFDNKLVYKTKFPISRTYEYIIISSEVTKWASPIEKNKLPASFMVDYIRVYKKGK